MTALANPKTLMEAVLSLASITAQELMLGGASLVVLLGMWLCWGAPKSRMSIEEEVKDGRTSTADAQRRIQRNQWFGPLVTTLGVGLLAFAITR